MKKYLDMPEECIKAVKLPSEEVPIRLKRELALRLYDKGLLSFGKARQLSEMSRWDFQELLAEEGIRRHYDVEELEEDLQTLEDNGKGG